MNGQKKTFCLLYVSQIRSCSDGSSTKLLKKGNLLFNNEIDLQKDKKYWLWNKKFDYVFSYHFRYYYWKKNNILDLCLYSSIPLPVKRIFENKTHKHKEHNVKTILYCQEISHVSWYSDFLMFFI